MNAGRQTSPSPRTGATWLGHPRGLSTLFFTELWERFSYYGMRGILILFMTAAASEGGLGLDTVTAGAIYGLYTSAVYLLALPGGWVADRLLGQRRAILTGGAVISLGAFTLAVPSVPTFYAGLLCIVVGTGLLKPNVSAIVGGLYPEGGARRDAAFSIFYMGINIGAFLGPLVSGYLGESVNWRLGFGVMGIGMIFGIIQFRLGYRHLHDIGLPPEHPAGEKSTSLSRFVRGIGMVVGAVALLAVVRVTGIWEFTLNEFARSLGGFVIVLAIAYFAYVMTFGKLTRVEKKRVSVVFMLFVGAALFWSGFEQAGSSFNLFAEQLTNRVVFGWEAPAAWLQSVPALFVILLAPVFGLLWLKLGERDPSIPVKFGFGLVFLAAGFFVMAWGASFTGGGTGVSPMWLVTTYVLHTLGELCLSPVGLSSITKLAPQRLVGQMMGIWFMGSALGNLIAGLVGGQFEALPLPGLFASVGATAVGAGLLFLVFSKPIRGLIGGKL